MTRERSETRRLDLGAQHAEIRAEITQAIERVIDGGCFLLGPEVEAFEREFAAYCDRQFAVGCASGSDALLLALLALGIAPGDEVLCPAYSFFATAGSIARLGAKPVFADIDPATFNLDPDQTRRVAADRPRLRAILPVHLFGQVADMEALTDLAEELGVPIVEDAAQSIGADDAQGRRAGSRGSLACFSFYPSKNLGALGDAGMVVTDDAELAEKLRRLRVHGATRGEPHREVGIGSRLDAVQAAVLRVKLRHLERWTKSRREHAALYDRRFSAAGIPLRTPRPTAPCARHVYHQYVARVPAELRDPLRTHLDEHKVETAVYYSRGLHEEPCFAQLDHRSRDFPHTEAATRECVALPVHAELEPAQIEHVIDSVTAFFSSAGGADPAPGRSSAEG